MYELSKEKLKKLLNARNLDFIKGMLSRTTIFT